MYQPPENKCRHSFQEPRLCMKVDTWTPPRQMCTCACVCVLLCYLAMIMFPAVYLKHTHKYQKTSTYCNTHLLSVTITSRIGEELGKSPGRRHTLIPCSSCHATYSSDVTQQGFPKRTKCHLFLCSMDVLRKPLLHEIISLRKSLAFVSKLLI